MTRARTDEDLKICVAQGWNYRWHGQRALRSLYRGVDAKLVRRVMAIIVAWAPATSFGRLPDDFVPHAKQLLAKAKHGQGVFLTSYDGDLREGCAWLAKVLNVYGKTLAKLPPLAKDTRAVAAARAAVVAHGAEIPQLLGVLACDGSAESLDALVDVVHDGIAKRGDVLDALTTWFVPFATNPRMRGLAAELTAATAARGAASDVLAFARRFDPKAKRIALDVAVESRQLRGGYVRKASLWVTMASDALPHVQATITWNLMNHLATTWEDGVKVRDENKLGMPKGIDDLPRWAAASARKLKITWDPTAVRISSSLRGRARTALLAWLGVGA